MNWFLACANIDDPSQISVRIEGDGAPLSGVVELSAAVEAPGRSQVRWTIDGTHIATRPADDNAMALDTTRLHDGNHDLDVELRTPGGQVYRERVEVWVDNHDAGSPVTWVFPSEGQALCGAFPAEARADQALALSIDGGVLAAALNEPARHVIDPSGWSGEHVLGATVELTRGGRYTLRRHVTFAGESCGRYPVASLVDPAPGASLDGTVSFLALVDDEVGAPRLGWSIDDGPVVTSEGAPHAFDVDLSKVAEGSHTLALAPTDTDGLSTRSELTFHVDHTGPVVELALEPGDEVVAGPLVATASVSDNVALAEAWIELDGEWLASLEGGTRRVAIDGAALEHGSHLLEAYAVDAAGHASSATWGFAIDNPPTIEIASPRAGVQSMDEISLVAYAHDDDAVSSITWWIGGQAVGTGSTTTWDSCAAAGPVVLRAEAGDSAGQSSRATLDLVLARGLAVATVDVPALLGPGSVLRAWTQSDRAIRSVGWSASGIALGEARHVVAGGSAACPLRCPESCEAWVSSPDLSALPTGAHVLTVTVTDATGAVVTEAVDVAFNRDVDGDGFDAIEYGGPDFDDHAPEVSPAAVEVCDGIDNDCDGSTDEDFDGDGDGYLDAGDCPDGADCNDDDASVNPAASEACDGIDNDCDGGTDLGAAAVGYRALAAPPAYAHTPLVDGLANLLVVDHPLRIHAFSMYLDPGASSVTVQFVAWLVDGRGYTWSPDDWVEVVAVDVEVGDGAGWYDSGPLDVVLDLGTFEGGVGGYEFLALGVITPGGVDVFHGDHGWASTLGPGLSLDALALGEVSNDLATMQGLPSYGLAQWIDVGEAAPSDDDRDGDGYTEYCGDCADEDATRSPDGIESCNALDDDCNGTADEGFDADGDGWGDCLDCDDSVATINPAETEVCDDWVDEDCSGWAERCRSAGAYDAASEGEAIDGHVGGLVLGTALALVADIDGDGDGEVLLGASEDDDAGSGSGSAWLLAGPPGGDAIDSASYHWTGGAARDALGGGVAAADVDGDGLDDLILGAPGADTSASDGGAVYLLPASEIATAALADALRVSGDEAALALGTTMAAADFGGSSMGLVLGAPSANNRGSGTGSVLVWTSAPSGSALASEADLEFTGEWDAAGLGGSITTGDFDGDGLTDVAAGAPTDGDGSGERAAALVFLGVGDMARSPASADCSAYGAAGDLTATSLAAIDLDGDGTVELAVGSPGDTEGGDDAGAVALVDASCTYSTRLTTTAPTRLVGSWGDLVGASLATAGDTDNDGADDLVVGSPGRAGGAGAATLVFGGIGAGAWTLDTHVLRYEGAGDDALGTSVAAGIDLDGDGYPDFAAGAPGADDGGWSAGAAYLFTEFP